MRKIQSYSELAFILIGTFIQMSIASAANLDLSSSPLFLAATAPPNILIMMDNSISTDYEILTKAHWERAAYEYGYASGPNHTPTNEDITIGHQLTTCANSDGDCGILRKDGAITLSGPELAGAKGCTPSSPLPCNSTVSGNSTRNYLSYEYLSSCYKSPPVTPCCDNFGCYDDNFKTASCTAGSGDGVNPIFSLANCPATEALDWRVRSAALNVLYYNPNVNYTPWKLSNLQDANFTAALGYPYQNQLGYYKSVNLGSDKPLGVDPTSCTPWTSSSGTTCTMPGFVYYVWEDDKGYNGNRPHRGLNINMTNGPNGMVDLWDSHYKVTVTTSSMKIEEINCSNTYKPDGTLNCTSTIKNTLPLNLIPGRKLNGNQLTLAEEQQNIANWFQYYRRCMLTIKSLISEMPYIAPNYRYGLMTMSYNQSNVIIANDNNLQPLNNISPVTLSQELIFEFPLPNNQTQFINFQQHNQNMLDALYKFGLTDKTLMRETLNRAGKYYTFKDTNNTSLVAGTTIDPIISSCQRNYSLIITDGYYTISSFNNNTVNSIGDVDGDGSSVTLADVARSYYSNDIRSDFTNILNATSCDDPNNYPNYQNMITFGISLGADGLLRDANGDGWPDNIVNPAILCPPPPNYTNVWNQASNPSWANNPQACAGDCPEKIDDLWHAAYNSHGAYTFAQDPEKLRSALRAVLDQISTARTFATPASSSNYYSSGSKAFLTSFESQYWTGDLQAFTLDASGNLGSQSDWSAAGQLNSTGYTTRNIVSYKPLQHQAIAFAWNQFDSTQQTALNGGDGKGQARVDFIRGKGAGTGINRDDSWINSNTFRMRPGVLGDIIQSDPVYVGQPFFRYDEYNCMECSSYTNFKSAARSPMVYVGANDGMLHGFDATTGQEKLAYIPGSLIDRLISGSSLSKLVSLTSRNYTHQYYVDGSATVGDAYFNNVWHTVLVGSLRAGGQAVFALDITGPTTFDATKVLWEFSDNDDADLGYTFSKPIIVRLHNGKWAALFGNGYNNTEPDGNDPNDNTKRNNKVVASNSGEAVLFGCYLDASTSPCSIKKSTGVGINQDPTQASRPNGLATPAVVDVDDDLMADYVYVGDLFGNLWKFDIRDPNPNNWTVVKLFEAIDNQGVHQPITVRPIVDTHPYGKAYGQMLYFGTGKYVENSDNQYNSATQQSFYGIWDNNYAPGDPGIPFNRSTSIATGCQNQNSVLFKQQITTVNSNFRKTTPASGTIQWYNSSGAMCNKGWYMDFPVGEKQVSNPTLWNRRVIFTTLVLPQNPQTCDSDGSSSWLMVVDANDGGTLNEVTFDLTGDFKFDQADLTITGNQNVSGVKKNSPRTKESFIHYNNNNNGFLRSASQSAPSTINPGPEDVGRQSWRQLWR